MKKIMMVAVCALCANVFAEAQQIGDTTTTWERVGDVLTIGGTGEMPDWTYMEASDRPWDGDKDSIKSVIIDEGVTRIGVNAFVFCTSLTNITMTVSVTSIGEQAFGGCVALTCVTIPSSVTNIESGVFTQCNQLRSVMMKSTTPPELGGGAFGNLTFGAIYVPARCKEVYLEGKGWGDYESKLIEAHFVTIAPTKYGTVTVDEDAYYENDLVKVTVKPDQGRVLTSLIYTDGDGQEVAIISLKEFWMPGEDVEISAEFSWDPVGPWNIGEGVTAHMDNKTLVIEGKGAMNDFERIEDVPWGAVTGIETVTIGEEVTKIGKNAWSGMPDTVSIDGVQLSRYALVGGGFAPVIPDDMILVTKESITAAKATTISVEDNEVKLGVSVKHSDDITAEPSTWEELESFIITIPVKSKQGFMILRSGEGRVEK